MVKRILISALLAFGFTNAYATPLTVNFQDLADGNVATSDGSGDTGERGYQPYTFSFLGGLKLTVRGYETNGTDDDTESYAYMDKGTAGMGVCTALNSDSQCDPSSDDNVSSGEYLRLLFNRDVVIDSLTFNSNHDGGFLDSFINIDGLDVSPSDGTGSKVFAASWSLTAGDYFDIGYVDRTDGERNSQFYLEKMVVSEVPEPSSIFLMGLTLLGLGLSRKKQK